MDENEISKQEELEQLGREVSHKCSWDGCDIMTVAIEALTDANFHTESEILEWMAECIQSPTYDDNRLSLIDIRLGLELVKFFRTLEKGLKDGN